MKRIVLLTIVVLSVSSLAVAQVIPGSIGIFVDAAATDCNLIDAGPPGIISVFVVHVTTNGSTASQWMLDPGTFAASYVAESSPFITIGDVLNGISVAYGGCESAATTPILLATVQYFATGTTPACALMSIVPDDDAPTGLVEIVDCAAVKHTIPAGGQARVNPDSGCMCNVPVQDTSWGQIKALYN